MTRLATTALALLLASTVLAATGDGPRPDVERAKELKDYIRKEKAQFEARETERRDALEELDRLNADQNHVRERMGAIVATQQELNMALENLSMEVEKQHKLELVQKERLYLLLKIAYRIRKDGMLRFLVNGDDLSQLAGRVRILFRTLKMHGTLTRELGERATRLAESERKLAKTKEEFSHLLEELNEQEGLLNGFLERKKKMLKAIGQKQNFYQAAMKEYRQISKHVATLFDNFESQRDSGKDPGAMADVMPSRGTLPLPLASGNVVSQFGRSVHKTFQTVTYRKGIEIEAEQNTPVKAILPGVVEYDGWVKGLGNVLILHHGNGFYTLSAHLYKTLQPRGTRVAQGEAIGLVGDTGSSERPSLYFEIRENGKAVDPLMYFSPQALASLH